MYVCICGTVSTTMTLCKLYMYAVLPPDVVITFEKCFPKLKRSSLFGKVINEVLSLLGKVHVDSFQ